jgi:TonB family protein
MLNRIFVICVLAAGCVWAQEPASSGQFVDRGMNQLKVDDYSNAAISFQSALDLDSKNVSALKGIAAATYNQAAATQDSIDKNRMLNEAARWNQKLIELNPREADAYYSLGVIAWTKVYPELRNARARTGMKADEPGPLRDASIREEMRARFQPAIEEGIQNLQKSLEINPTGADTMAYLNLLLRSRADIADTAEQASADSRKADEWVKKSMEAKRVSNRVEGAFGMTAPPPPPPPPPGMQRPGAIRVGGNVAAANLVTKVEAAYPPLALQARIQGTVRFNLTIGKDGHIENITLVSGHPLLVAAAQSAVQQWVYKPTLLNGQPMLVITTADVNFTLSQ